MADPLRCCVVGVGVLRPRVVMTACGKNGVGKTPTMANLSASLARLGLPVVAVDADAGPSQPGPAAGHGSCFFRDLPLIAFIYIRKYD